MLGGKALLPGQVINLPNLAHTFREVATYGKDGFYKRRVAQAIVDLVQSKGGVVDLKDLANHESSFSGPISCTYGNDIIYEVTKQFEV